MTGHGGPVLPVALALLAAVGYEAAALRAGSWPGWRLAAFTAGCAVTVAALTVAGHTAVGHMQRHVLLGMVAPVLLVAGAPGTLALRVLPTGTARALTGLLRTRAVRLLTHPVTALVLSTGTLPLLYSTGLYAAVTADPARHALLDTHLLASGVLFAHAVAGVDPDPHRAPVRVRLLVLAVAVAAHATLAQLLYAGVAVRVPGTDADRRAAATLMYYGGDLAELLLAGLLCFPGSRATRKVRRPAPAASGIVAPAAGAARG